MKRQPPASAPIASASLPFISSRRGAPFTGSGGEREGIHANAALLQRLGVDLKLIGEDDRSAFSQLVKVELHRLRRQGEHEVYRVAVGEPLLLRETYLVEVVGAAAGAP